MSNQHPTIRHDSRLENALLNADLPFTKNKLLDGYCFDYHIKNGRLFSTVIIFFESLSDLAIRNLLNASSRRLPLVSNIVVVLGSLPNAEFAAWAEQLALICKRKPKISVIVLDSKTQIGRLPAFMYEILRTGPIAIPKDSIQTYQLSAPPAPPDGLDDEKCAAWISQIRAGFKRFALAEGRTFKELEPTKSLVVDVIDEHGFVFCSEVTDQIYDQVKDLVLHNTPGINDFSLVGCFSLEDTLQRGGEYAAIYALHPNYQVRAAGIGDNHSLFEKYLETQANIKVKDYSPFHGRNFNLIRSIYALIGLLGILLLAILGLNFDLLADYGQIKNSILITGTMSLLVGVASGKVFQVGKREFPPAVAYASLFGLVAAFPVTLWSRGVSQTIPIELMIWQIVALTDLAIIGGVGYAAFTKTPPQYILPLKPEHQNKPAGINREMIHAALQSWDRGWAVTIPDFDKKITITKLSELQGFTIFLDSLFEQRVVKAAEQPGSLKTGWKLQDGLNLVERKKWSYSFAPSPRFDKHNNHLDFVEMGESFTCPTCAGSGSVTCPQCKGKGIVACYETEYYKDEDGKTQTRTIESTKTCPECNGTGWVTCNRCAGSGMVTRFPRLFCTREPDMQKTVWDPSTGQMLRKVLFQARSKTLVETPILNELINLQSKFVAEIPLHVQEMVKHLGNEVINKQDSSNHIIRQKFHLSRVPLTEVDYEYQKKQHKLWVYGYDNDVYAKDAPKNTARLFFSGSVFLLALLVNALVFMISRSIQFLE